MQLNTGLVIAKKYRLDRQIGAGGMGEVWSAHQEPTKKLVALKFLKSKSENDAGATKRFLREARAVCAVRHPNVVEVHDVLELEDGSPVMVMEFLDGESLEQRLVREGRIPFGDLAAILARTVSAVGAAHEAGIVHRDLKPDNIFLSKTSVGTEVKVLDFGIAKVDAIDGETAGLTNTGTMLGTPYYMSPEQAFGEKRVDHRADIWSLGIILYRGISGVLPTKADNLGQILKILMTNAIRPVEELVPSIPDDLKDLITRMLAVDPEKRPADLREVRSVLDRYAGVETADFGAARIVSVDTGALSRTPSPPTRNGNQRWLTAAVGALVVVAALLVVMRLTRRPSNEVAANSGIAVGALSTAPVQNAMSAYPHADVTASSDAMVGSVVPTPAPSLSASATGPALGHGKLPTSPSAKPSASAVAAPVATTDKPPPIIIEKPIF